MSSSYKDFFDKAQTQSGIIKKNNNTTQPLKPFASKAKSKKKKSIFSFKDQKILLTFVSLGFVVTLVGGIYTDEIFKFLKRIDISMFSNASAEEASTSAKSDKPSNAKEESSKGTDSTTASVDKKQDSENDEVELNHLARLRERKIELDKREEELAKLEEELTHQRKELEQKLKELENIRRNISSTLEEKVQNDDQKIQDLVAFYSNMKPPQAAKVMETLDETLAVRVIEKMKKKNAADILNLLKPEKAQALSEKYAGYRK